MNEYVLDFIYKDLTLRGCHICFWWDAGLFIWLR